MRQGQSHTTDDRGLVIDAYYSFPGIIIHELAHKWAAERRGLAIRDYQLWNWRNGGHVSHEPARNAGDKIAVAGAPVVVNTLVSISVWTLAAMLVGVWATPFPRSWELVVAAMLGWIGWAIGKHALPSRSDAAGAWRAAWARPSWSFRQAKQRAIAGVLVGLSKIKPINIIYGAIIGLSVLTVVFVANDISWRLLLDEYEMLLFGVLELMSGFF